MSRRKTAPPNNKIRVTLLSSNNLVMEGWEQALKRAPDIEIYKHRDKPDRKESAAISPATDILLLEASWMEKGSRNRQISLLKLRHAVKVIAVFKDRREISRHRRLLDEAIQAGFHRQELINLIRGLRRDDKSICNYYDRQLKKTTGALEKYAQLTSNILQLVFAGGLGNPQIELPRPGQNDPAAYIVFENRFPHPFWTKLKRKYGMDYAVFSIQNDPALIPAQIAGLAPRLSDPFGRVGFLVNRSCPAPGPTGLQVAKYRNEGVIILPIFDQLLHNLLASKAAGAEPTDLVEDIFQELFVAISALKK